MTVPIERRGDTLVLRLPAQLTVANRQELKQQVVDELDRGERRFVIDLAGTLYIDSSGLGVLVTLAKKAHERGGELRVAHLNDDLMTLFRLTKLDMVLPMTGNGDDERGSAGSVAPLTPRPNAPQHAAERASPPDEHSRA